MLSQLHIMIRMALDPRQSDMGHFRPWCDMRSKKIVTWDMAMYQMR